MTAKNFPVDPLALSQALVRRRSITPADDGALQILTDALTPLGFACTSLPFGEINNLFARFGKGDKHFCFGGHTDVVPPGDEKLWKFPPFSATVENGILYGRGTADMKADVACFVSAASAFLKKRPGFAGSISLLITGDEEAKAVDGTVKVLEWMDKNGHIPDVALVGEPSNPEMLGQEIKIGRRGSFNGTITVAGKQGHSAYPERADNPLPKLVTMLERLENFEFDKGTEFFPPTNLEIVTIDTGNPAFNVIPAAARANFNIRFNNLWDAEKLDKKIRSILDEIGHGYKLETFCNAKVFLTKPGDFTALVAQGVESVTRMKPLMTTKGGSSDARFFAPYCPVAEFGLVNKTIHQVDEHVAVDDLYRLAAVYEEILVRYFEG